MTDRNSFFSPRRQARAVVILLLCLLTNGCAKLAKDLGEISKLRAEIVKEFAEKEVSVFLNNDTVLTIRFFNSPLNDKTSEERTQRAEQTAAFVKSHYASIEKLNTIWVIFVKAETRFIFVHYSQDIAAFPFDKDGRPLTTPEHEPTNQAARGSQPTAIYSEKLKQTDVVIQHLQLEGDASFGMSVAVHFTVRGDATGLKRSSSYPEFVSFDFSSSSEKSMFPGEPKIGVIADGKVVLDTAGQFSTSKSPDDDKFSEYLALHVPYQAFRRIVAGKRVTLLIGDRAYEFTAEHLSALREMTKYVKE